MIGVTAGNIDQLAAFSTETEHCSGKFPVAADPDAHHRQELRFDAGACAPAGPNRTSYVIAPDDKVHLRLFRPRARPARRLTLDAVTKWRAAHPH